MNIAKKTFKQEIVLQYQKGKSVSSLVSEYGIPRSTIYSWIKNHEILPLSNGTSVTIQDFNRLTAMHEKQSNIIAIMKSTCLDDTSSTKDKVFEIQRLSSIKQYSINELCEALNISKDTYYRHIKKSTELGFLEKRRLKYSKIN